METTEIKQEETRRCSVCSEIKPIEEFKTKDARVKRGYTIRKYCLKCRAKNWTIAGRIWEKNHPEYAREYAQKYRINNPEKYKERQRKHDLKSKHSKLRKENRKRAYSRMRKNLSDKYIISLIRDNNRGLSAPQIRQFPELIELQRLIIKTKRLCKTSNS